MENNINDNVENSIKGYKYIVGMVINIDDPLGSGFESGEDKLCICDTRDECVAFIKEHIESNLEASKKYDSENIYVDPYTVTRLDAIVKWHDGDKSWFWTYGIYPVRYIQNKESMAK